MKSANEIREAFYHRLDHPMPTEQLFDQVPDITFFVKDHLGRYVAVNKTLYLRCGVTSREELIGKTVDELFPSALGESFAKQDQDVLKTARSINGQLELHLYPDGLEGWCLTYKEPIFDKNKLIIGLSGISRDLNSLSESTNDLDSVSDILLFIEENIHLPLRLPDLANKIGLSVYQLDQRIRSLYHISSGQLITRTRVNAARHQLMSTGKPIAAIAMDCGYSDQSAFSRQFKQITGISPKEYRNRKSNL